MTMNLGNRELEYKLPQDKNHMMTLLSPNTHVTYTHGDASLIQISWVLYVSACEQVKPPDIMKPKLIELFILLAYCFIFPFVHIKGEDIL